jgi:hypothetical protein
VAVAVPERSPDRVIDVRTCLDLADRYRRSRDTTPEDLAARIGYSQMHVSRLLRRALARLPTQLVEP